MEFCDCCDNMLYIRDSEDDKFDVKYYCKNCSFEKEISKDNKSKLIIQNMFNMDDHSIDNLTPNIEYDKTIPHVDNIECPNKECSKPKDKSNDVMYVKTDIINIKYVYYCTHCKQFWENK
jgi:DNA-directed RNA polymerase subunit M/transcription elongation factor TFIIS